MKRSFLRNAIAIGLVCAGLVGCKTDPGSAVSNSESDDPTAWSGTEVSKEGPSSSKGLPKTSGRQGGWSSEARDIEKSLGYGR